MITMTWFLTWFVAWTKRHGPCSNRRQPIVCHQKALSRFECTLNAKNKRTKSIRISLAGIIKMNIIGIPSRYIRDSRWLIAPESIMEQALSTKPFELIWIFRGLIRLRASNIFGSLILDDGPRGMRRKSIFFSFLPCVGHSVYYTQTWNLTKTRWLVNHQWWLKGIFGRRLWKALVDLFEHYLAGVLLWHPKLVEIR